MAVELKRDIRRMILETARKQFLRYGLKKTTVEEIAQELKISKKTLYEQFKGKQEIWEELLRIEAYKTTEYLKTYLSPDSTPMERLEKLSGFYFRRQLQSQETPPLKDGAEGDDTQRQFRELAMSAAFPDLVTILLEEASTSLELKDLDNRALAELLTTLIDKAASLREKGYSISVDIIKELALQLVRKSS